MSGNTPSVPAIGSLSTSITTHSHSTLEDRLAATKLTPEDVATEVTKAVSKTAVDALVGLLPGAQAVTAILSVASEADEALKKKKLEMLLAAYFNRSDQMAATVEKLGRLVTSPWGNALFGKIVRILDDNPPDGDLLEHLGRALTCIVNSDFRALFEEHKFALAQIEQLTPQALTLIADHDHWPFWEARNFNSAEGIVTTRWDTEFGERYGRAATFNSAEKRRLIHTISDLRARGFAHAELREAPAGKHFIRPTLTPIARELLSYLAKSTR